MKRMSMGAVALAAALALGACGRDAADERRMTAGDAAQPGAAPMARVDERGTRDFVQRATEGNLAEIELSKLGEARAQNPEVRKYAEMMIEEHTKALNELRQVAERDNLQINQQLSEHDRNKRDELQGLKGADFDREYMNAMVDGHEKMLDLLKDQANRDRGRAATGPDASAPVGTIGQPQAADAQLSQWASQNVPVVEGHHQRAEALRDQLGNRGSNR